MLVKIDIRFTACPVPHLAPVLSKGGQMTTRQQEKRAMTVQICTKAATPKRQQPEDRSNNEAETYLRHVEKGVSIRALAREAGCHPSTVLRRIRRFEERREDPLVDGAITARAESAGRQVDDRQFLKPLRRLAEPGAAMIAADGMAKAIITRDEIRTAVLDRVLAEEMALKGWVAQTKAGGRVQRYILLAAGREALRSMIRAAANSDHADQHRIWEEREIDDPEDGSKQRRRFNLAESPLLVLARRRDARGRAFLTTEMVTAGERLREDFELAQMGQRVTQNWESFLTAGTRSSYRPNVSGGGSSAARERVSRALADLGHEMGNIVLRVCCYLEGIERAEQHLGWPARSGKLGLRLALIQLARHYERENGRGMPLIG